MALNNRTTVLDPIDVVTGECFVERTDFSLPGPIPLEWKAYYSNQLQINGSLGWRWIHSYNRYLLFEDEQVSYVDGQGSTAPFGSLPPVGEAVRSPDNRLSLHRVGEDRLEVTLADNLILAFYGSPATSRARLETITNLNGQRITFRYDRVGRLDRIDDSAGRSLHLQFDELGHILAVIVQREGSSTPPLKLVAYQYNRAGDLIAVTDAENNTSRYAYDQHHQLTKRTNRNGYSFSYEYAENRCVKTQGDDGLFYGKFTYQPEKQRTIQEGYDGRKIEYRYDQNGVVTEEVDPYGRSETTQYDAQGNLVTSIDRCGRGTVYAYDDRGNKIEEIDPTGRTSSWTYNERNQMLEETNPRGEKTVKEYDDRGNLTREETPDGTVTEHEYDANGNRVITRGSGQLPEKNEYDQYRQLIQLRDLLTGQEINKYSYDLLGNITGVGEDGEWVHYVHDRMSRLTEARFPNGNFEKNTYDPEGNTTSFTNRLDQAWKYRYRARQQLIEETAPDGGVTKYDYTKTDELCSVIDPNGNRIEYKHDLCDKIIEIHHHGSINESHEVDPEGRLIVKRDAQGEILEDFNYDVSNQPVVRTITRAIQKIANKLTYNEHDRVTSAENDFVRVERDYDDDGRQVVETQDQRSVQHEYDDAGRLIRTSYDGEHEFHLKYHDDAVAVRDPSGDWHTWYYDGDRVTKRCLASGVEEALEYDDEDRLIRHTIGNGGGTKIYHEAHLSYNTFGQLTRLANQHHNRHFEYDVNGRLVGIRREGPDGVQHDEERLTYDPAGNLLADQGNTNSTVGAGNQLTTWGERRYTHDQRGCRSTESRGAENFKYTYDSAGQLIQVDLPDGRKVSYKYDALQRRVSREIGDQQTLFGWDGNRLSWEQGSDGTRRLYFYAGPDEYCPVMFCDARQLSTDEWDFATYFVHYDQASRPILITDGEGQLAWSAELTAYGMATVQPEATIEYNLRAPGQYFDAETGLHYNYHRYYDPRTGRFLQPDPIGLAGGPNLYAYGEGNPLVVCDVLGLANT